MQNPPPATASTRPGPRDARPAARSLPFAGRLLAFAALLLLPLLLALLIDRQRDAEHARADASEQVRLLALAVARDGEEALRRGERLLEFLAGRTEIRELDLPRCNALLKGQTRLDPLFANAGVIDVDGRMLCSSLDFPTGLSRHIQDSGAAARAEFAQALLTDEVRIGQPVHGTLVRRRVLPLTRTLRDAGGRLRGVMVVTIDLQTLSESWQRFELPQGGVVTLHDKTGVIVARLPDPLRWVGTDAAAKLENYQQHHPGGQGVDVGLDGIQRLYSLQQTAGRGWKAIAGLPVEQVFAEPRQREREALAWAGGALGLALLLALAMSHQLSAPLRRLARSAAAVADGRRDLRAREDGPAEFRTVAHEFNRMLDNLAAAELRAQRANGMYQALSRAGRALLRARDKQQLCADFCAACVDAGHSIMTTYWRLDGHELKLFASAGPVVAMYGGTEVSYSFDDPAFASSPSGQAVLGGKPVVSNDYLGDPRGATWHGLARLHGVRAMAALPLLRGARVEGLLVLHVNQAGWFDDKLLQLLNELLSDLAFGFELIEREAERAATEAQLVRSKERFQRLFQGAPLPVAVFCHPEGRLIDANPAYVEGLGLPLEQMRGHTLNELGMGLGSAEIERMHLRLREQHGRLRGFETPFRLPDGRVHEVQINADQIEIEGQSALLTISADLTLRKRTEDALRESLTRFELAASTGHVWAWRPDVGLKPPTALLDLLGYAADELSHQPGLWLPEVHAPDRERLLDALRRHVSERAPLQLEFRMRGRDGQLHWLQASGQAQWGEQGQVLQMAGIVVDVSERHRVASKLQAREQQLSGIIETAMDAIVTVDAAQRIVVFNQAAAQMFGIDAQAALGQELSRFIPAALREAHQAHVRRFASTGVSARRMGAGHALTGLRADGGTFPIEASISLLRQGDSVLMTAVVRDISDARDAEQARAAQLAAEAANRAKSQLVSRVAHELRNPLNAVLGFVQLLQADEEEPLSARQGEQVQRCLQAGWHLAHMIDDLLDAARGDAGELRIAIQPVLLKTALCEAIELSALQARRQRVQLQPLAAPLPALSVLADAARLRQVLINLLSNAIKYNRPGGTVRVEVRQLGDRVSCDVIDDGLGMTQDQLQHLFEPFNRLGREHSGIEGTGIGMVLVRQLVEAMGGSVQVQSQPGQGTRVQVQLMSATAGTATPEPASAAANNGAGTGTSGALPPALRGSLLYVEDDEVNRLLVEQMLKRWPALELRTAATGAEGLAARAARAPDLLLLDMHLPDMDGIEFLRRLRAMPGGLDQTVVSLSANALPQDQAQALAAGAADYWTKPLDLPGLASRLQKMLARASADRAPD